MTKFSHELRVAAVLDIGAGNSFYGAARKYGVARHARVRSEIGLICDENKGRYGYRRVAIELRKRGFVVNHKVLRVS